MLLKDVLLIFLGWLLGIIAGPITQIIGRARRKKELEEALNEELRELRQLMAALVFRFEAYLGHVDHELLDWLLPIQEAGTTEDPEMVVSVDGLRKLRSLPASEMAGAAKLLQREGVSLGLKKYSLPLLDTAISELVLLKPRRRREILEIRKQLDLMNQDVPRLMELHDRTFDESMHPANREVVRKNMREGYAVLSRRARNIADRIGRLVGGEKAKPAQNPPTGNSSDPVGNF